VGVSRAGGEAREVASGRALRFSGDRVERIDRREERGEDAARGLIQ
jgi:hypothetical protein